MSYLVLARKWRPKNFSEVVGQQHVLRALVNGLDQNRLHHAFLFSGTRGIGKTTLARILAKSINCEQGISSTPCGECQSCVEVDEGRFVDLIEVDAASRTKVDDTRELLDNVQYAPGRGRHKVYLIDEVHMLSAHSFNALLKTLEEPPPHVKFLFATTDPQKLPVTILSRCLQFNLRRLDLTQISDHLAFILQQEQIPFEHEAVLQLARAADGSMRDGLSLLDQAIAFAGGEVKSDVIFQMLGSIDKNQLIAILSALADQDGQRLLQQSNELSALGRDFYVVIDSLLTALQQIATLQMIPDMEPTETLTPELAEFARRFTPETVQLLYQITLHGKRDMNWAADPKSGFDMTLLRLLSFQPATTTGDPHAKKSSTDNLPAASGRHSIAAQQAAIQKSAVKTAMELPSEQLSAADRDPQAAVEAAPPTTVHCAVNISAANWTQLITGLPLSAMGRQLADNCSFVRCENNVIYLTVADELSHLATPKLRKRLQKALRNKMEADITISFERSSKPHNQQTLANQRVEQAAERQQQAIESIHNDPVIESIKKTFNARIIEDSIKPVDINEVNK